MPRIHFGSRHARALDVDSEPDDWRLRGNCTGHPDPDTMFPFASDTLAEDRAVQVCVGCPVTARCGQWALENREPFGVWGGMTERERAARLAGRVTVCPNCRRGHYQRHWNQVYCVACRRPARLERAERVSA